MCSRARRGLLAPVLLAISAPTGRGPVSHGAASIGAGRDALSIPGGGLVLLEGVEAHERTQYSATQRIGHAGRVLGRSLDEGGVGATPAVGDEEMQGPMPSSTRRMRLLHATMPTASAHSPVRVRLAVVTMRSATRIGELSVRHLVALRFASDAELPELARRVLEETITTWKAATMEFER